MSDDTPKPERTLLQSRPRTARTFQPVARKERKLKKFLATLRKTGKVAFSAKAAGYTDTTFVHKVYSTDEEFAREWDEAVNVAFDMLEDEAWRRAHDGIDKPVLYKGEIVAYEKEYSDQLLMFRMRAGRPEKYRDNVTVSGTINHNVGVAILPMTAVKMEDWQRAALEVQGSQKLLAGPVDDVDDEGKVIQQQPTLVRR